MAARDKKKSQPKPSTGGPRRVEHKTAKPDRNSASSRPHAGENGPKKQTENFDRAGTNSGRAHSTGMHEPAGSDPRAALNAQRRELRRLPRAARVLALLLVLVVGGHTALVATWVAPNNEIRQAIGAANLRSYILPAFEQNWSIFAPNPRRTAVAFEVRAMVEDPATGEAVTTDWVDLVAAEEAMVRGNPFAPRMASASRRVADRLHSAVRRLNDEQRGWIEANYVTTPVEQLRDRLTAVEGDSPANATQIDNYMVANEAATSLATAFAEHYWDGEVIHVQYRSSTRPVPSYPNEDERTVDDTSRNERQYGWRAPSDISEQELQVFHRYLERLELP